MSPEELDEIRERVRQDAVLVSLTEAEAALAVDDRADLLAEVERLRDGIEALADRLAPLARIWQEQGEIELSVPMNTQVADLRALLNPTEGDD